MINKTPLTIKDVQALHRTGRLDEAKAGYLELLKANPLDVAALHYLAILNAEQGDFEAAQNHLERAVELDQHDLSLKLHLANIYKARGLYGDAMRILLDVIKMNPHFAAAYNNLGTVYFAQDKWRDAINSYQAAIDIQSDYIDAYYNLGLVLTKANHIEEAVNVYKALLELAPQHSGGRFQLARLFMQQNQYQAAIDQFYQIEQEHPHHFETQTNLATCFLKLGWLGNASTHYVKALNMAQDDVQILFNLGVIAMQQGRTNDAIEFYSRALKIDENMFEAHNNLAVAWLSIKNIDHALKHFREALRIQPDNEAVRHSIKILMRDKNISASPPEYIRSLFDSYADHYDAHTTQTLNYQVPKRIFDMVNEKYDITKARWDILDLGCGTGLCGAWFKSAALSLTGVDLSEKMLAEAAKKNIYDNVVQSDIQTFLNEHQNSFDLILAGDVLVYFGHLDTLFTAIYQSLRPNGLLVFNAEINEDNDFDLLESGRFAHNRAYLDTLIEQANFKIIEYQTIYIRAQDQSSVLGHLYLLKKTIY